MHNENLFIYLLDPNASATTTEIQVYVAAANAERKGEYAPASYRSVCSNVLRSSAGYIFGHIEISYNQA